MIYNYVVIDKVDGKTYYKGEDFDEMMDDLAGCMAYYEALGEKANFEVKMYPMTKEVQNV